GYDVVNVGNGLLSAVNGAVNVVHGAGTTELYVRDDNDTTGRTATLSDGSLRGLSAGEFAEIDWSPSASATGGVVLVDIHGPPAPAAGSTYNVVHTPALFDTTILRTGADADTVHVNGTTGSLYIENRGGGDSIFVGNGTLSAVNGLVDVYGAGATYLYVEDGS